MPPRKKPHDPGTRKSGALSAKTVVKMKRRQAKAEAKSAARAEASAERASERRSARAGKTAVSLKPRLKRIAKYPSANAVNALASIIRDPETPARERVEAARLLLKFAKAEPDD